MSLGFISLLTLYLCSGLISYTCAFPGTFGVQQTQKAGSVGLRLGAGVSRAVCVGNDMLGSSVVNDVPAARAVVADNLQ